MCRNIRTLYNFQPPATTDEIQAAAIQYVRKISGYSKPSLANSVSFEKAVGEIAKSSKKLLDSLETSTLPKNRDVEAEKARERNRKRFANR